jgi:uncharacterized protein YtpQ (UPF0354 family)
MSGRHYGFSLGRNYFLFDLDVVEKQDLSAPNIRKMVVSSALPSSFQLSFIQCIIYNVFRPFLFDFSQYYDAEHNVDIIKFKEMTSNQLMNMEILHVLRGVGIVGVDIWNGTLIDSNRCYSGDEDCVTGEAC